MTPRGGYRPRKKLLTAEEKRQRKNAQKRQNNRHAMKRAVVWHMTRCVCPRCGMDHVMNTFNVGKEPCRKFCERCRYRAEATYIPDEVSVGYRCR